MKLAANISHPLLKMLCENPGTVDLIKLSRQSAIMEDLALVDELPKEAQKPVLFHTFPRLGESDEEWNKIDWSSFNQLVEKYQCPHLSIHFDLLKQDVGGRTEVTNDEARNIFKRRHEWLSQNVMRPLIYENSDYWPITPDAETYDLDRNDRLPQAQMADFIRETLADLEAKMLLDLSHARCFCSVTGENVQDYLLKLPLEKVRELHLVGAREKECAGQKILVDCHYFLTDEDYRLLEWLLNQPRFQNCQYLTLEYGGFGPGYENEKLSSEAALREQLGYLGEICHKESQ